MMTSLQAWFDDMQNWFFGMWDWASAQDSNVAVILALIVTVVAALTSLIVGGIILVVFIAALKVLWWPFGHALHALHRAASHAAPVGTSVRPH